MQTVITAGFAEQTVNKSKFLAWAARCETEREVGSFLRAIAQKHANASHLAYAYRVKTEDGVIPRFSDAGEPSGTAGKPILQMLDGRNIIQVAVGVIRYYGGVNLGTGGLVKAYGGTAKLALDQAALTAYVEMRQYKIITSYKRVDELTRDIARLNGQIIDKIFAVDVQFIVKLPALEAEQLLSRYQ
jgi:uncharacterized YigZ family protein